MEGFNKGFSPKKAKPSNSGDENDVSIHDRVGANKIRNNKKPVPKHFMSPTISAASKAAVPRRKVLGERNESLSFSDTHLQKSPNLESITRKGFSGQCSPRVISSYSCAPESDDDENKAFTGGDSSSRPYDPVTNYLSPRPKFLRYKPNRRHDFFLRLENEADEENDELDVKTSVSFDPQKVVDEVSLDHIQVSSNPALHLMETVGLGVKTSVSFDPKKITDRVISGDAEDSSLPPQVEASSVNPVDEEIQKKGDDNEEVVEEDETEEFEEGGGWRLKVIMKYLLVMVVLFLSTSYILYMNSPTPSYTQMALWGLKDGYNRFQEHSVKGVSLSMFGDGNESQDQMTESQLDVFEVDQRIKEDQEFEEVEVVEDDDEEVTENSNVGESVIEVNRKIKDGQEFEGVRVDEKVQEEVMEAGNGDELVKMVKRQDEQVECSDPFTGSGMDKYDVQAADLEVEKEMKGSDLQAQEVVRKYNSFEESQTESDSEMLEAESKVEIIEDMDMNGGRTIERDEELISHIEDEAAVSGSGKMESEIIGSDGSTMESISIAVLVVLFPIILVSLFSIHYLRKSRVSENCLEPPIKKIERSMVTETSGPAVSITKHPQEYCIEIL